MQSANIPTGPRNPNAYTEDEVLRAIRGIDGYRELSFRYELLDQDLNLKRKLDNIMGGSVQMHYISAIKRTADFEMVGGEGISWLDDHIKPYCQIKMPPRIVQDGIVINTLWSNSFDAASGTLTPANSVNYGSAVSSTDGVVRYSDAWSAEGIGSALLGADDGSDSGRITINFRARETWRFRFYANIPVGGYLNFFPDGLSENTENYMRFDDVFQMWNLGSIDTTHIKDNLVGQPIRVEVVNDGYRARYSIWWTDIHSTGDPDFSASENSSFWEPIQVASIGGGGFTRDPSHVDEILVAVPGDDEYIPRTVPLWSNTFNGASGDVVDNESLRLYGNTVDEIRGELSYNETWWADNSGASSLQLGDTSVSGNGSIQISIPPREDWNLKMWANIPSDGKLYIAPSSEESIPEPDEEQPWAGPIEKIGTGSAPADWNFTTTVEKPVDTQQGDFLIAAVTTNGEGVLNEPNDGWEQIGFREFGEHTRIWIFSKEAGPSEPAHFQFTFDKEHWHSSFVVALRNTDGVRQIAINADEDITSVDMPVLGAIDGDALFAIGFDWNEVNKQWSDGGVMTTEAHQPRGMLVSSLFNLPTDPTPSYTLTTDGVGPSRMAAVSVVVAVTPDPDNPNPYPGAISNVGVESSGGFTGTTSVSVPAGTAEGDLMITTLSANANNALTPASGWDFIDSIEVGTGTSLFMYSRFATSSEPSDYTWTWDGDHWHFAVCTSWRNVLGIQGFGMNGDEGINETTLPQLSVNSGDVLLATGFDWEESDKSWDDGGSMTELVEQSQGMLVSYEERESGTTPAYEFTSDFPDPTRLAVGAVVLEAYQDEGEVTGPFRGPNWIVLDDEGGEYSIAGVDVTAFRDILFDTPIRIEVETSMGEYFWRVYSTDPFGDAPDINWFGDSTDWGVFRACLFQGGGETAEPALIDNVTVGRTIPVNQPTPDSQNYVEFPLGVFLMSSPTRHADEDDVVTRDIEAYDRTKLFIDDKITEIYTVPKGTVYTDVINELLGDVPKRVEPSDFVAGRDREFAVGTSKKEIIDNIAEGINYHTLRFDEEGRAVVQPYVNPTNRAPEYNYQDNEISIMFPDVEVEFDTFDIANVWIVSTSEADSEPLFAILENHDPANPFSVERRGRRIVDFRQEETTTDETSLKRKVKRLQYEANREYENISFNTLINPLHSDNDCYTIIYGPLGIDEKYTELNWEIPLEAGSTMTHTARRVVKLDAEQDEGFIENHLEVVGSLTAGNIKWGSIVVPHTTEPLNVPVSVTVTGLDLKGSGAVQVLVTPSTSVPGTSVRQVCSQRESPDGFEIWSTRRTAFDTTIYWMAMRGL